MAETQRKRDFMLILVDLLSYTFEKHLAAEGFAITKDFKF